MAAPTKIAVAGATGRVGHQIGDVLEAGGYDVVPIARASGVDVISGEGLAAALTGVDSVIDAATGPSPEEGAATEFFTTAARNLQEAGDAAGVQRIVVVSIIGCHRFTGGYGAAKLAHERATQAGPIPARVVRAAQFHEFVAQLVEWGTQGEVTYLQNMRTQLVSARTVAELLVDLAAVDAPELAASTSIVEVAGPREENLVDMATLLVARRGDTLKIEGVSQLDDPDHGLYESGALLPGPGAILAGPTFEEWLETAPV